MLYCRDRRTLAHPPPLSKTEPRRRPACLPDILADPPLLEEPSPLEIVPTDIVFDQDYLPAISGSLVLDSFSEEESATDSANNQWLVDQLLQRMFG